MWRAVVISFAVHLIILSYWLELPALRSVILADADRQVALELRSPERRPAAISAVGESETASPVVEKKANVAVRPKGSVVGSATGRPAKAPREERTMLTESSSRLPEDLEREYRIKLAREVRQGRYYPENIKAMGLEGIVRMSISHVFGAGVPKVSLDKSSGHPELDELALDSVKAALGRAGFPVTELSSGFRLQFALEYRLAD